ncbi:hypothetical protein CA85_33330 [Allorhodopirellula solitaria]|uniref:Uncharacterized protein n=1 Tax=Allorhodopirellula solitaria TaxID=2527987 RepID=A0A5C5XQR5_9BACT|nr:hypothetical protein CA85_33330 [Allorhodopirellula solitaria]
MLGIFKPTCPVDGTTKDWIERRFDWLTHLRPDAKAYVSRGIRYITKVQDCGYLPAIQRGG